MILCPICSSSNVKSKGKAQTKEVKHRYKCSCGHNFYVKQEEQIAKSDVKRYVITSCQNNVDINEDFFQSLKTYCKDKNALLMIMPMVYRPSDYDKIEYRVPEEYQSSLVKGKVRLHDKLVLMGSYSFNPTTANPLAGLEPLSKGDSMIIPSPQLRMKSLAMSAISSPAILITTGAISNPEYISSKASEKASFNHSYSAIVVEVDADYDFHIRVLNADQDGSFYDLDTYYEGDTIVRGCAIAAIVTGDEHAIFCSEEVKAATYTDKDSIVNTLKPLLIVRHDVLDCYSVSHHHRKDSILAVGKLMFGKNLIEKELDQTIEYIKETTPSFAMNYIVPSNHTDHLSKWLKEVDIKTEPWNAKIYHKLMYEVLSTLKETDTGVSHEDPFTLYCKGKLDSVKFLDRSESYSLYGIELNAHGDVGSNGSRGSLAQYSNLANKYIIGHSHTPGIVYGAYQVGTSSKLKLEYTRGPSSWMNTHCIIHQNGTRQLINIINGKWHG